MEDFFFLIEKELRKRLGPDLAGRLHTARSRNDIDHTLFKLGLKHRIDPLLERMVRLAETLTSVAERESNTLIVAYTHGQPAQPTVFGHYLSAVLETLLRDIARLEAARDIVDRCPMGAAAITTSGFPIDRDLMAHLLGFSRPLQNSYSCIASIDYVTSTYSAIELCLPASRPLHPGPAVLDELRGRPGLCAQRLRADQLDHAAEAQSRPIEHMRHLASQTVGRAQAMLTILHNTPFTDMNDSEGESQGFGYGAFESGGRVLDLLAALVPALRINPERVRQNIRRSCITVTELADSLVRLEGLSFREAHEIAAEVARSVVAIEGDIATDGYQAFQEAFQRCAGRKTQVEPTQFADDRLAGELRCRPRPFRRSRSEGAFFRDCRIQPGDRGYSQPDARDRKARRRIRAGPSIPFHRTSRRTLMATIALDSLVKRYGQTTVVHGIDLAIQEGEFVVLVGPSGCGKSTTLRMIAGLEEISGGQIRIDGRIVNDLQPKDRNIAMVFQNYAIYPHMTVADNIAFGLYP